jgi:hypothetical protein
VHGCVHKQPAIMRRWHCAANGDHFISNESVFL